MEKFGAYSFLERVCAMFSKKSIEMIVIMLLVMAFSGVAYAQGWEMIHGEIRQVFPEERKVLLDSYGEKHILLLTADCEILRKGKPTGIASLRPITQNDFQDAIFWVNSHGQVSYVLVNYSIEEEQKGILVKRDIFGNIQ